jgi:hypothetical protein
MEWNMADGLSLEEKKNAAAEDAALKEDFLGSKDMREALQSHFADGGKNITVAASGVGKLMNKVQTVYEAAIRKSDGKSDGDIMSVFVPYVPRGEEGQIVQCCKKKIHHRTCIAVHKDDVEKMASFLEAQTAKGKAATNKLFRGGEQGFGR